MPKAQPYQPSLPANYKAILDEFGAASAALTAHQAKAKPIQERCAKLRETILSWVAEAPADLSFDFDGRDYGAAVTAQRLERTIPSMKKVLGALGEKRFLALCSIPIKALDDELNPDARARLIHEEPSGRREVRPVARFAQKAKKAA